MSNTADNGGSAFPTPGYTDGMSLRDWFAGQALAGIIASGKDWDGSTEHRVALRQESAFSMAAYVFADAMLRERKQGGQP